MALNKILIDDGLYLDGVRLRGVNKYFITQNNQSKYIGDVARLTLDMDISLSCEHDEYEKSADITIYEKGYYGIKENTCLISFELPEHQFEMLTKSKAWAEVNTMLNEFKATRSAE